MKLKTIKKKIQIAYIEVAIYFIHLALNLLELHKSDIQQTEHMKNIMYGYEKKKEVKK